MHTHSYVGEWQLVNLSNSKGRKKNKDASGCSDSEEGHFVTDSLAGGGVDETGPRALKFIVLQVDWGLV
jgi:hypothetical protein